MLTAICSLAGCNPSVPPEASASASADKARPLVVIGIDGAEWSVIEELWDEGRLPVLRGLAERGARAPLGTAYTASPVIWTTIATGKKPRQHGITDFVVGTPRGDVPVSSRARKVPALWNMTSAVGRRAAVLGWWATWPAEPVEGLVVSDRALLPVADRVFPPQALAEVEAVAGRAGEPGSLFPGSGLAQRRDDLVARLAPRTVAEGYDLVLAYFRSVDVVSHRHWKHYRPGSYGGPRPPASEIARFGEVIPRSYEAVDAAIGRILAAATPEPNVLVISDHGFVGAREEIVKVVLDFDRVLEALGFLRRAGGDGEAKADREGSSLLGAGNVLSDVSGGLAVDLAESRIYTYSSPDFRPAKYLRFSRRGREPGGRVQAEEVEKLTRELTRELARVTFDNGEPAFLVRPPRRPERARGAELVARVRVQAATERLLLDGRPEPLAGTVRSVSRVSGTHRSSTDGIFIAAGPDIDPAADLTGLTIHDMAPTVLFALGLPVAEDFAGRPWLPLFTDAFRKRNRLRTITTWGTMEGWTGEAPTSEGDAELLEELRSLGYL